MSDVIFVNYDPFANSSITILNNENMDHPCIQVQSQVSALGKALVDLTYQTGIYHIKISCPASYFNELQYTLYQLEQNYYSQNKIELELI